VSDGKKTSCVESATTTTASPSEVAAAFRAALHDLLVVRGTLDVARVEGGLVLTNLANGARLEVADSIEVYDGRGALRLKVGDLS